MGKPAVNHRDAVPACWRQPEQTDECMRIGLGQDGRIDCSGLVIVGIAEAMELTVEDWPSTLRHTRQMVEALTRAGEQPRRLGQLSVAQSDLELGDLVFSHRLYDIDHEAGWHVAHVSIHTGYMDELRTQCVRLQAQAGYEGQVVERQPEVLPPDTPENLVFSPAALARLAFGHMFENIPTSGLVDHLVPA